MVKVKGDYLFFMFWSLTHLNNTLFHSCYYDFILTDAVKACTDESVTVEKRIEVCVPLYTNMIALHQLLER